MAYNQIEILSNTIFLERIFNIQTVYVKPNQLINAWVIYISNLCGLIPQQNPIMFSNPSSVTRLCITEFIIKPSSIFIHTWNIHEEFSSLHSKNILRLSQGSIHPWFCFSLHWLSISSIHLDYPSHSYLWIHMYQSGSPFI